MYTLHYINATKFNVVMADQDAYTLCDFASDSEPPQDNNVADSMTFKALRVGALKVELPTQWQTKLSNSFYLLELFNIRCSDQREIFRDNLMAVVCFIVSRVNAFNDQDLQNANISQPLPGNIVVENPLSECKTTLDNIRALLNGRIMASIPLTDHEKTNLLNFLWLLPPPPKDQE